MFSLQVMLNFHNHLSCLAFKGSASHSKQGGGTEVVKHAEPVFVLNYCFRALSLSSQTNKLKNRRSHHGTSCTGVCLVLFCLCLLSFPRAQELCDSLLGQLRHGTQTPRNREIAEHCPDPC